MLTKDESPHTGYTFNPWVVSLGSTLYSEGSFVRRFFSPKPFEVAMVRRTYGPKVLYSEVPLLRKLLCSEDSIFRTSPVVYGFCVTKFFPDDILIFRGTKYYNIGTVFTVL